MTDTASWVEILSAVVNVVGLWAAGEMMRRTRRRKSAVRQQSDYLPGGPRILAAWRHLRCEFGRMAFHASSISLGIWSMVLPDAGTTFGYAAMWSRVILGVIFTIASLYDLASDDKLSGLLGVRQQARRVR